MDPALVSLLAASVAFVGSHFALSHPLRAPLVGALGENGFRILYSLVALATFIWAATAFRSVGAGGTPLWDGMSDAIWSDRVQLSFGEGVLKGCGGIKDGGE